MKNAQDEGLKPQPTDITASSVVINKSEENSPQIQIPLINEDSTKTQPVLEAIQKQENSSSVSSASSKDVSAPVSSAVPKEVPNLAVESSDKVKPVPAVEVKPIVSQEPQDNLPQVQPPLVNEDTVKAVTAVEVLPKPEDREQPLSQSDREIEPTLDQVVLKEISALVTEGNDRINHVAENGILVLGKTGAGKSTLAHVLAGRKLQSIFDDEIGEFIIDTLQPIKGIKIIHDKAIVEQPDTSEIRIGHSPLSETTIPNKIIIGHNSAFETAIPNKC